MCVSDAENELWHTVRTADKKWPYAFRSVQAETRKVGPNPGIGPTPFVACAAAPNGDLHVCVLDAENELWHTVRTADKKWPYAFRSVQAETRKVGPNPGIGPTPFVACAAAPNGDLHVCVLDAENELWHTVRTADKKWPYAFRSVQAETRRSVLTPGSDLFVGSLARSTMPVVSTFA